nr:helix-hairpin-helix domain-containing protein [Dechloromonas sp.]
MNPSKVSRERLQSLTDLPNIGPAAAVDLHLLGIHTPAQLLGRDPYQMYEALYVRTGTRHDPCVLDVFISITRFMAGEAPKAWWKFTAERKRITGQA